MWKLDRLGRSLRHLVDTITGLADRGIGFRSRQEAIDMLQLAREMHGSGHYTVAAIAKTWVSRAPIYRHLTSTDR